MSFPKRWKLMFNHGSVVMTFQVFLLPRKDLTALMMLISKCQLWNTAPPSKNTFVFPFCPSVILELILIYCCAIPLQLPERG